jgi:hypothetical protein
MGIREKHLKAKNEKKDLKKIDQKAEGKKSKSKRGRLPGRKLWSNP